MAKIFENKNLVSNYYTVDPNQRILMLFLIIYDSMFT